ncbi:MAG: aminotransferase class I/II-fold pyridoxal phosphate-dependent enzyme, partial [Gammaproteobacteria bacterium]
PVQTASIAAWRDEDHVRENREHYRKKFQAVVDVLAPVLDVQHPDAGFYLWPRTPVDDERFAKELFASQNVTVLPGSYLSRAVNGHNPGERRVRMALVAPLGECIEAAERIRAYVETL